MCVELDDEDHHDHVCMLDLRLDRGEGEEYQSSALYAAHGPVGGRDPLETSQHGRSGHTRPGEESLQEGCACCAPRQGMRDLYLHFLHLVHSIFNS